MDVASRAEWNSAVQFFEVNAEPLKLWRNDMGGHFQFSTAKWVVENIDGDTAGAIEISETVAGDGASVSMRFVTDVILRATVKDRPSNLSVTNYIEGRFQLVDSGFKHAAGAMHAITLAHLWPVFA